MNLLARFIKASKELKGLLEQEVNNDDRDRVIQKIEELLTERQKCLAELSDLSSLTEKSKEDLVKLEKEIQVLMENQKNVIHKEIKTLQLKKQKNNHYANPYENLSVDGMFLDKKK